MNKFLTSNGVWFRFGRTVSQAVIGFIISKIYLSLLLFHRYKLLLCNLGTKISIIRRLVG